MYAAHFGLRDPPFNNTPDPRFFRATADHEEALACLVYAVQERKGFTLLTGEVGAGKTLIARMMLRHFGDGIASAMITNTSLNTDDLLAAVCSEFDIDIPAKATRFDRIDALQDYLLAEFAANRPVALVLDEAQNLSDDTFEQLRMIGNLEADDAKLLQIVIVGQPELRRRFAAEHMCQLNQRIFRSFHLPALSRQTCTDYIRHRLCVARGTPNPDDVDEPLTNSVFDDEAIDAIYAFSRGLPRLINTACDNAMLCAFAADRRTIDRPFMQEVVAQLAQPQASEIQPDRPGPERTIEPLPAVELESSPSEPAPRQAPPVEEDTESGVQPTLTEDQPDDDVEDQACALAAVTARARDSIRRVGKIYAAADRTYQHLIHHLADIQRPTAPIRFTPDDETDVDSPSASSQVQHGEPDGSVRRLHDLLEHGRSSLEALRLLVRRAGREPSPAAASSGATTEPSIVA